MKPSKILLKDVRTHNLKSVSLELDRNQLIVFTGVSGSGKSSLAFDTLYVEGQRRYVASLSNYARRQLGDLAKPDMESADGITPTISIEQKTAGRNPRSTVGTMTELYDFLRVLYARIGIPHCPVSGEVVSPQSREKIIRTIQTLPEKSKILILAPYARAKKAEFKEDFIHLLRRGFMRVRVDGEILSLDQEVSLDGSTPHDVDIVVDRISIDEQNFSRIAESLTAALEFGKGVCSVYNASEDEELLFSMHAFSPKSGLSYTSLEPQDFSFNSPSGMCPRCQGMGIVNDFDLDKIIDPNLSIAEDCCSIASSYTTVRYGNIYDNLARLYRFDVNTPWQSLSKKAQDLFLYGTGDNKWLKMQFIHPVHGYTWEDRVQWRGVVHEAHRRITEAKTANYRKKMQELMLRQKCPECLGSRLRAYPAAAQLNKKRIWEVTGMTVGNAKAFFETLPLTETEKKIGGELLKEITERLAFLHDVGLHYLTLDRTAPTLSGGEAQRVRLASQIGCGLVGITYILDEPSIGLHPRDNKKLIQTLEHLRDIGNTVIVVEHDEETIAAADYVVDFGPGAGSKGGHIVCQGSVRDLAQSKQSITGAYISGRSEIPVPKKVRKKRKESIDIIGASHHNLKNVDVSFPLGVFTCITGVSGSGKSSLISDILFPALDNALHRAEKEVGAHKKVEGIKNINKVIAIDQTPIGRNPRSNPATYIKLFDEIRQLFSMLPESQARGYEPGRFSFNVKEGSCPHCNGMGMVKIEMDFMDDDWVDCTVCHGRRFDSETLSIFYKGKSIFDVLEMDVSEALEFFQNIPSIKHKLEMLHQVGMDYIKLGQSSTTLSGGEAQRIKLAKELVRPDTGDTLYILDEPTTGLHFHDIRHLLDVLHELVDRGNTVIVIEHNMDVVKTADWIIDLGPEGGAGGGKIVAKNTPAKIAKMDTPTGKAIAEALQKKHIPKKSKERKTLNESTTEIQVEAAEQNNLQHINLTIPRHQITVCTGPSGSGKTSLAYETVYAEGQRRYVESLSPYARQFIKQMPKPKVGRVSGLSPAIAIEQRVHAGNPRSTVGTMTEIYDFLRILYARVGIPHCPETGERIKAISKDHVVDRILELPEGTKLHILAEVPLKPNDDFQIIAARLLRQGYLRIRLNGTYHLLEDSEQIAYQKKKKNELMLVIDRLVVNGTMRNRLFEAVENAAKIGHEKVVVAMEDKDVLFNLSFSVEKTGKSYPEIVPQTFAFNTQEGMCPGCEGLGYQYGANLQQNPEVMNLSIRYLMSLIWWDFESDAALKMLEIVLREENIEENLPLEALSSKAVQLLMNGSSKTYEIGKGLSFRWAGINPTLAKLARGSSKHIRAALSEMLDRSPCVLCNGARINALARHVTIHQKPIHALCSLPIDKAFEFVKKIPVDSEILEDVKAQLTNRLEFLLNVGLDYMSLDRSAPTLSGGETQRIRLARQLGSGLTGVLYMLDEPSIGLHPFDSEMLNQSLKNLIALGNTLLLVEHDPLTIQHADYILDFGPQSGEHGGHITARGTLKQILKNKNSLTGNYLSGRKRIPIPQKRRKGKKGITIKNATLHNLKDLNVTIPSHCIACITGVSGSGKSTLIHDILVPAVKKGLRSGKTSLKTESGTVSGFDHVAHLIDIDQAPIGTTVRSNVGTYVGILDHLRTFFSKLPAAQAKGLKPGNFSFNHKKGMCTACYGLGYQRVELHFLPPVEVTCEQCKGLRLNPVSLTVEYQDRNFGQFLNTTINEARDLLQNHPRMVKIFDTLIDVGLGYLKIGQEMHTLSGGEAQRIKLSGELSKRYQAHMLYVMDEPTTGLHSDDIEKLLKVLHRLVDQGHSVILIEHNMDMIINSDYVIDLGPGAGIHGGKLIVEGTPEEVAQSKKSKTAPFLMGSLGKRA